MKWIKSLLFVVCLSAFNKCSLAQWSFIKLASPKDLSFTNTKVGYIDYNYFYLSTDSGHTFSVSSDSLRNLLSLQMLNDSEYFITYNLNHILYTNNGGSAWKKLYLLSDVGDTFSYPYNILFSHFYSNGNGFVMCSKPMADSCQPFFVTNNNGLSWSKVDCKDFKMSIYGPFVTRKRNLFEDKLIMISPKNSSKLLKISEYGNRIQEYSWDITEGQFIIDIAFRDSLNGLLLFLGNHTFYRTSDGGKTITPIYSGFTPDNCARLSYAKPTAANPQGYYMTSGRDAGSYYSFNDGETWVQVDDTCSFNYLNFYNNQIGFGITDDSPTKLMYFTGSPVNGMEDNFRQYNFQINPNPFVNFLHINQKNYTSTSMELLDLSGKSVLKYALKSADENIETNFIQPGIYFCKIHSNDGFVSITKLVKTE